MSQTPNSQQTREKQEPNEANRPIPIVVLSIIGLLLAWAVYYLATSYEPMPAWIGDNRVEADFIVPATADGGQIYAANCVACHQAGGAGVPGVFPPLAGSEWVNAKDAGVMVRIVLHGINGPLTVLDTEYNGEMPHFSQFSDEEIAALVSYVRGNFGNTADPIDAQYVAQVRSATEDQTTPWKGDADLRALLDAQ